MGQGRIDGGHELPGLWRIRMLLRLAGGPTQARSGIWATRPHVGCYKKWDGRFDRATRQGAARRLYQKRGREDSIGAHSVRALPKPIYGMAYGAGGAKLGHGESGDCAVGFPGRVSDHG